MTNKKTIVTLDLKTMAILLPILITLTGIIYGNILSRMDKIDDKLVRIEEKITDRVNQLAERSFENKVELEKIKLAMRK